MSDDELTAIYNEANGLDSKRHNPITTDRIFAAMRATYAKGREAGLREALNAIDNRVYLTAHKETWLNLRESIEQLLEQT